ncbi:hypothetical protein JQK62_19230, partial [Leptospira santarosai]|nr:hypothetical protein [Leptospira santarosai]
MLISVAADAFRGHDFSLLITSFFRGLQFALFPLKRNWFANFFATSNRRSSCFPPPSLHSLHYNQQKLLIMSFSKVGKWSVISADSCG